MIDSHAHLDMEAFDTDREQVLARAKQAGVQNILTLGLLDERDSYRQAIDLAELHPEIYLALGCTPHDARFFGSDGEQVLERLSANRPLLAIGEVGLDYHHNLSPPEIQREVFRRQISVARNLKLPLIIHHRDAENDLLDILDQERAFEVGGIFHSYTASLKLAQAGLERGFLISFSGILTFKNADSLREVAREIPLDKLLLETDCPYLAPVPRRGKRNEPSFVWDTARKLAEVKGVSPRDIEAATDRNFRHLFNL